MGKKSISSKGKAKVTDGKYDEDKTGGRKRKDRSVLQFFDDAAYEVDDDDDSDFSDDSFFDEDFTEVLADNNVEVKNEPARTPQPPVIPKEEQMDEEELDQMLRERYRPGSGFVTYAEDNAERNRRVDQDILVPTVKDLTIWKVKCTVGRERHSAFCLMQKYVDLLALGTKLQIVSAFSLDHVKGSIYIEADKECDVHEACKGLCNIYSSRVAPVPKNEVSQLVTVRSKPSGVTEGTWARVKSGKYKGDLAQVVAVNDVRKKVTVKLIPRIDLQAITEKFGGGVAAKKRAVPAPRLISSTELEDFRPLIQYRKDRDTNLPFEVLDGKMLKDGYLYKKVSTYSLSLWGAMPTEAELLKFEPSNNDGPKDLDWLTELYGTRKKKRIINDFKGGNSEKGEGSSSSSMENNFEVDDLVFFGRKDFGIIIGKEKDDSFKIMKEGSERPVVVSIQLRELKRASFDKKLFTVKDQLTNTISIGDAVRILDGPSKERQGIVKRIYKGIIFLYDQSGQDNNGYICAKGQMCEKIAGGDGALNEKGGGPGPSGFADLSSSPKSPLLAEKSWGAGDGNSKFQREDKNGMFSVGQSVRIRVGPLKGYLCRVLAIRRSDVTVKLDSQQKILTVKCENLAEVHGRSSVMSHGDASESAKPFNLLGAQDGSQDWMVPGATATVAEGDTWNAGASSTERSSWPAFPTSSLSMDANSANPTTSVKDDSNKGAGDSVWETRATQSQNTSWGASGVGDRTGSGQDGWTKPDNWGKTTSTAGVTSGFSDGWAKNVEPHHESTEKVLDDSWGKAVQKQGNNDGSGRSKAGWGSSETAPAKQTECLANTGGGLVQPEADVSGWNKAPADGGSSWGKQSDANAGTDWKKQDGGSSWGKQSDANAENDFKGKMGGNDSWAKPKVLGADQDRGSSWNKQDATASMHKEDGSSWNSHGGGSAWGRQANISADGSKERSTPSGSWKAQNVSGEGDGSQSSWGKQVASSSWNKKDDGSFSNGGTSWDKNSGGSSWNKKEDGSAGGEASKSTWGKKDGGSAGGSSWSRPADQTTDESKMSDQNDSWKKPRDFGSSGSWKGETGKNECKDQEGSWGRPREFEGGRGSGGRRGRGGWRGGRDQISGGRSFNQGQSSSWTTTEGEGNNNSSDVAFKGNQSSWNNSQERGWGKAPSSEGSRKADGWGQPVASAKDDISGEKQGWEAVKGGDQSSDCQNSGGWNASTPSNKGGSSGWNKNSAMEEGGSRENPSDWDKNSGKVNGATDDFASNTAWTNNTTSFKGKQSAGWGNNTEKESNKNTSAWNSKSSVEQDAAGKDQNDPWISKKNSDGGSSKGWGQSNAWKSGTNDAAGATQESWSNKSSWNSGSDFSGNEQQPDSYGNRGRGGSGRGGYRGRGGSDRGGFGGRGGFQGRGSDTGGYQGRGSDRGGYQGRGSDGGGFRGRGRGRRDESGSWMNKTDSGEDKPYSWNKGSSNDADGWKSNEFKGSWSQGNNDKGNWQSAGNAEAGGWKKSFESDKNAGGSGTSATPWKNTEGNNWKSPTASVSGTSSVWGQQTTGSKKEDQNELGTGWSKNTASGNVSTSWTANKSNTEEVNQSKEATEGSSDVWGKAASPWGKKNNEGGQGGW